MPVRTTESLLRTNPVLLKYSTSAECTGPVPSSRSCLSPTLWPLDQESFCIVVGTVKCAEHDDQEYRSSFIKAGVNSAEQGAPAPKIEDPRRQSKPGIAQSKLRLAVFCSSWASLAINAHKGRTSAGEQRSRNL